MTTRGAGALDSSLLESSKPESKDSRTTSPESSLDSGLESGALVLFGGSFDPPHIGHMEIITALHSIAKHLIIVPAFRNPFKPMPIAPIQTRITWLQTLCAHLPKAEVSDYEMRAQQTTKAIYAIEWVEHFVRESTMDSRADFASKPLLALGSDSLASLPRWRDAAKLAQLVEILPILRDSGVDSGEIESAISVCTPSAYMAFSRAYNHICALGFTCQKPLALRPYAVSSSQIRAAIARGEFAQIAHALPQSIAKLVRKIY